MSKKIKQTPKKTDRRLLYGVIAVALIAILATAAIVLSQPPATSSVQPSATVIADTLPAEISVAQAAAKRDGGAFILDVREPEEWNAVHIPGATLIPLGELQSRVDELPKDQEIVVVCRSGNRSGQGRDILRAAGLSQSTSMAGGMNEWQSAGYEVVTGP